MHVTVCVSGTVCSPLSFVFLTGYLSLSLSLSLSLPPHTHTYQSANYTPVGSANKGLALCQCGGELSRDTQVSKLHLSIRCQEDVATLSVLTDALRRVRNSRGSPRAQKCKMKAALTTPHPKQSNIHKWQIALIHTHTHTHTSTHTHTHTLMSR